MKVVLQHLDDCYIRRCIARLMTVTLVNIGVDGTAILLSIWAIPFHGQSILSILWFRSVRVGVCALKSWRRDDSA